MTEFTKEQLVYWSQTQPLAAFALAMLDQNEALRRDKFQLGEERAAEWKRAEKAEAERDEANDERDDAVDRWARRAREAETTVKDYLTVQAERDRLREELREAEDGIWALLVAYSPEGHDAPRECFATGPLTGDPINDLVLCPACAAEKHPAVRRARERAGRG